VKDFLTYRMNDTGPPMWFTLLAFLISAVSLAVVLLLNR